MARCARRRRRRPPTTRCRTIDGHLSSGHALSRRSRRGGQHRNVASLAQATRLIEEDRMELYPWLVFLHIGGAFLFVLAHGVSALVAFRLRAERDPGRMTALLELSSTS